MDSFENLDPTTMHMAVSMFLGLSLGNWHVDHVPSLEDPRLVLSYKGKPKGGRPFKLLNAAARPPKKYRPTVYWCETHVDLEDQTIAFYHLREKVSPARLMRDFGECVNIAKETLKHRLEQSVSAPSSEQLENIKLRRQLRVLAKQLFGSDHHVYIGKNALGKFTGELTKSVTINGKPDFINVVELDSYDTERETILAMLEHMSKQVK